MHPLVGVVVARVEHLGGRRPERAEAVRRACRRRRAGTTSRCSPCTAPAAPRPPARSRPGTRRPPPGARRPRGRRCPAPEARAAPARSRPGLVAEPLAHRPVETSLAVGAGQDPAVQLHRGPRRHHVARGRAAPAASAPSWCRPAAGARGRSIGCRAAARRRSRLEVGAGRRRAAPPGSASSSGEDVRGGMPVPDPAQQLAERGTALSPSVGIEAWPASPRARHPDGLGALLADRERQHHPAVGELQPLAAALVDREVGPDVGPGLEQPPHPDVGRAVLLVGHHHEATGRRAGGSRCAASSAIATQRAATSFFMSTAPRPKSQPVVDDGLERRVRPVPGVGRHHVEVADVRQRRARRRCPADPRHQVGPGGIAGDQLAPRPRRAAR